MSVTLRGAGTPSVTGTAVASITTTVSASAGAADVTVLSVVVKPFSATIADTLTGFNKVLEFASGATANGADTGSTKTAYFIGYGVAASTVCAVGALLGGSPDTAACGCVTYTIPATSGWDVGLTRTGADDTNGANLSLTASGGLAVATGDILVGLLGINSDNGSPSGPSFGTLTGATVGALTTQQTAQNNVGNDCMLRIYDAAITAGTSNVAPIFTYTNASASAAGIIFIRLREITNIAAAVAIGGAATATDAGVVSGVATIAVATTATKVDNVALNAVPTIGVVTTAVAVDPGSGTALTSDFVGLLALGYTGSLLEMRRQNLLALLVLGSSTSSYSDLLWQYLISLGNAGGSISDMKVAEGIAQYI